MNTIRIEDLHKSASAQLITQGYSINLGDRVVSSQMYFRMITYNERIALVQAWRTSTNIITALKVMGIIDQKSAFNRIIPGLQLPPIPVVCTAKVVVNDGKLVLPNRYIGNGKIIKALVRYINDDYNLVHDIYEGTTKVNLDDYLVRYNYNRSKIYSRIVMLTCMTLEDVCCQLLISEDLL